MFDDKWLDETEEALRTSAEPEHVVPALEQIKLIVAVRQLQERVKHWEDKEVNLGSHCWEMEKERDALKANRDAWFNTSRVLATANVRLCEALEKYLCRHKTHDPWCSQCVDRAALSGNGGSR